ncbi:nectin-2 isoform X2 [Astyanax mexicanus]|uniref:Si:ch73-22o12.1 n=1 Tax=Astyanax mexicanus TaxID=7994 RepID=A0A3B1J5C6_ASTMX|nr:nectin-2 isoform X2 [Astyanax mexicanus]
MVWDSSLSSVGLLSSFFFLLIQGSLAQRVKVQPEVVTYPGQTVTLRCQFPEQGQTELTQVSWIFEKADGTRTNIAVFHPKFGVNYPKSPVTGRVGFTAETPQLDSPTIQITDIKMTDEGRYICEYATYPSGNEQGVTSLIILAKPENSATAVKVQAGTASVVVASCQSANGRPASTISWVPGSLNGNASTPTKTDNPDNTVTSKSEYWLVPTPADNDKEISCVVSHRTLPNPETFQMKLVIEYPPQVQIVGYDNNWYLGRTNAVLTCQAQGNPTPTTVTWRTMSGLMPDTVQVKENKLTVVKVDETVNATFICEVRNSLGTGRDQVSVMVRETPLVQAGGTTGAIIGALIGVIILLALIGAAVFIVRKKRRNMDAPPTHKPPPPMKTSMTSDRNMEPKLTMDPLIPGSNESPLMYYETQKNEPMTDLDSYHDEYDEEPQELPLNHSAPYQNHERELDDEDLDDEDVNVDAEQLTPSVSRVDSFVSSAVIV